MSLINKQGFQAGLIPAAAFRRLSGLTKNVTFGDVTFELGPSPEPLDALEPEPEGAGEASDIFAPLTEVGLPSHLQRYVPALFPRMPYNMAVCILHVIWYA